MAGIENNIVYGGGFKLQPSSSRDISDMQRTAVDVSKINHTGSPEGVISANPSSLSHDPVSGIVYVKSSGTGNTGWSALSTTTGTVTSVSGTANRITSTGGATPVIDISASYVGQSSITTLGTIATGTWNATAIGATFGGTGQTTYATGDILYASAPNVLSKLAAGSNTQVLTLAGGVPTWAAAAAGTVTSVSGTTDRITSTGGATPVIDISASYVGQTFITTLGTITTGTWNGTAVGSTFGGTGQTTYATGDILYASGVNTLAKLAAGSNTNILTLVGGVPAWAAAPTGGGLLSATVTLTSAQIKALRATPITLVAAQGAGTVIVPVSYICKYTYGGSNVFVAGSGQAINVYYNNFSGTYNFTAISNSALVGTTSQYPAMGATFAAWPSTLAALENIPLVLQNGSATEITGNAANNNTATIVMKYYVVTI